MSVLTKPFVGELGHELMYWQAMLRHLKATQYKPKNMIVGCLPGHEILYEFADQLVIVPQEFITDELYHAQTTCESESDVACKINDWFMGHIAATARDVVIDPQIEGKQRYRHGYHDICGNRVDQLFVLLQPTSDGWHRASAELTTEVFRWGKYIVVYPRHKPGIFATRNWDYWGEVIKHIKRTFAGFTVVVVGVESLTDPAALGLADKDLIFPPGNTDLDLQIALLANASFAVTPISGCTFLSILAGCPTYVIGPEKCAHHLLYRNIFQTRTQYYGNRKDEDQMPGEDCLEEICSRIETFGLKSYNGRFSV
jgi:hypothetical protein